MAALMCERFWNDKIQCDDAEKKYYELLSKTTGQCSLSSEISKARQHIRNSLERIDGIAALSGNTSINEVTEKITTLEKETSQLKEVFTKLEALVISLSDRVTLLEKGSKGASAPVAPVVVQSKKVEEAEEDDDVDLFGEDSDNEDEKNEIREKRLAEYAAKKSKKPALIAKSNVILDCKPWDDETDMKAMETEIRKISADGLLLGASKLVPLAYGIHKLQISVVIEDDKISVDWLTEEIEKIEDYVQSVDIAAFNKI